MAWNMVRLRTSNLGSWNSHWSQGKKQWIVLWFSGKKSVNHWIFPLDLDLPFAYLHVCPPCIRGFRRLVRGSLDKTIKHRPGNPCFLPSNISIHSIQVCSVQGKVYRGPANIAKPCGISPWKIRGFACSKQIPFIDSSNGFPHWENANKNHLTGAKLLNVGKIREWSTGSLVS